MEWSVIPPGATEPIVIGNEQILQIDAQELVNKPGWAGDGQPGWAQFGFKAKDKGGNWSPGVTVNILVAETRYGVFMPAVVNP